MSFVYCNLVPHHFHLDVWVCWTYSPLRLRPRRSHAHWTNRTGDEENFTNTDQQTSKTYMYQHISTYVNISQHISTYIEIIQNISTLDHRNLY